MGTDPERSHLSYDNRLGGDRLSYRQGEGAYKVREEAVLKTAKKLKGAYGLVIMSPRKLIGVRDPYGLKPLCLGRRGNAYIFASESCALKSVGAEFIRDVEPGEMITVSRNGIESNKELEKKKHAHCVFEYIYFARLDSTLDGLNVYDARIRGGRLLAESHPADADLVTGVPESGIPAAKGFSRRPGFPLASPFIKTAISAGLLSNPRRRRENPACI